MVVDSRQKYEFYKRRYECKNCGKRYNTYELSEDDYGYITNHLKYSDNKEISLEDTIALEQSKLANSNYYTDSPERKERASYQERLINYLIEYRDSEEIKIPKQHRIVKKFGDAQYNICMEECAELIQAINKHIRYNNETTKEHLTEEISDVLICIEQLKILTGIDNKDIQNMVEKKWKRTKRRLL